MRILQLGKAYPPVNHGGVEVTIQILTEGLNSIPQVVCDAMGANDNLSTKIEKIGTYKIYRTACFGKYFSTLISPKLISTLKKEQNNYDVIHLHSPDPMAGLAVFLTRPNSKVVIHWHSDILKQKLFLKLYKPILNWLLKRADKIIATSPNYAAYSPFLKEHAAKTAIVPIGISEEIQQKDEADINQIRTKFGDRKIVFSLGRLAYYKGYEYLIKSAADLPDNYIVIIGGEGPLKEELTRLIQTLQLQNKVILLGHLSEKEKNAYLNACDLFVLCSIYRTEAFGIVQVEAMQLGKPLISTRIPGSGVDWVNMHGETGITVEPCNPKQISDAITKILEDEILYKKISDNCLKRYQNVFRQQTMIQDMHNLYVQLSQ